MNNIIKRDLLNEIKPFLARKEYLAIIGPRQAGKTTFLEIIKEHLLREGIAEESHVSLVTFEDRRLLREFEDEPVAFARSFMPGQDDRTVYLMLDEFQYAEEGGQKLKLIYDTVKNLKIIITGSSSLEIKAQVGVYMVGRVLTFHLSPFNFDEILQTRNDRLGKLYRAGHEVIYSWLFENKQPELSSAKDSFSQEILSFYNDYCIWGGYPAVVLSSNDREKYKVLGDIFNNYMLKDIKGLLELSTERNLLLLSQFIAAQIGATVVYRNMGSAAQLDFRKLKEHLRILKETFVCEEVAPFFKNRYKELTRNPKIYFLDMGFRNYIMENMNNLDKRPDSGVIVENVVFIRLAQMCVNGEKINFWRTKAGAEVDFIAHIKDEIIPIEVKFSSFDGCKITRGYASFLDSFKSRRGIVLTKDYWGILKHREAEILFAPVYYL